MQQHKLQQHKLQERQLRQVRNQKEIIDIEQADSDREVDFTCLFLPIHGLKGKGVQIASEMDS